MGLFDYKIYKGLRAAVPVRISTFSPESIGIDLAAVLSAAPSSGVMPESNYVVFCPFRLSIPITVVKLWAFNGAAVSGNVDVGIYNSAGLLQVSAGSTAQAVTNA